MDPEPTFLIINFIESINILLLISFAVLFLLLILSALISGAEVAFFSLSKATLSDVLESDSDKQKAVVDLLKNPQKLLATILISNNFINILVVLILPILAKLFLVILHLIC